MIASKKALLLDMNSTFMFGEDRFGDNEDFSIYYKSIGGTLAANEVRSIILAAYNYLDVRYPNEQYRHAFPSVETAILETFGDTLPADEMEKILDTFAYHELGHIPEEYVKVLFKLNNHFTLAVVIDIWSEKQAWLDAFKESEIISLFSASSFSSDHGMVKPSPKPFEHVLKQLNLNTEDCLVIGDSPRRDLGGATAAGIDCVLVGGASDTRALGCFKNLIEFSEKLILYCSSTKL